jgi:lipopolysaccharide export system protein LptA
VNIEDIGAGITVTLSKRNLEQLLAALEQGVPATLNRMTANGPLVVRGESDEFHYNADKRVAEVGDNIPGSGLERWLR